jgi:cellulose synthase/poly-beta-1,6-N-acetylglucosamine synthase-like glycosyltransferase
MPTNLWFAEILFWFAILGVAYSYLIYPCLICLFSRHYGPRFPEPPELQDSDLPRVSVLIAAHNEEVYIVERIQNALAIDYPHDKFEVIIASDGSTDLTNPLVRKFEDERVVLLEFEERRGKTRILNEVIPTLKGEIILLSDANSFTKPDALRKLVRWFQDERIGIVCGKLVLMDPTTTQTRNVDGMYWKYETFLKKCENELGALLGSNGAIYAMRKAVFPGVPENTIVDDFVLPLRAKIQSGCSIVYDVSAVAEELTPEQISSEFKRRSRIGAGGFQSIGLLWKLLNPKHGWVAFSFFSHKVMRWLCPFFMLTALMTNLLLIGSPIYAWLMILQVGFYLASVFGPMIPSQRKLAKVFRLASMFTHMNAALFWGFCLWISGSQKAAWNRTSRTVVVPPLEVSL